MPINVKDIFEEYKIKIILYTADELKSEDDLDLVRRDLFRRYNIGMTALTKKEVERAKYIGDFITEELNELFEDKKEFYEKCLDTLLPKSKRKLEDREQKNLLLIEIREMLVMPYMPIIGEKSIKVGYINLEKYYEVFIIKLSDKDKRKKIEEFIKIFEKIYLIKERLEKSNNGLKENILFLKSVYWMFSVLYKTHSNEFYDFSINDFCHYVENGGEKYFNNYKNMNTRHIEARHKYMNNYITQELKLDINKYLENTKENRKKIYYSKGNKPKVNEIWNGIGKNKQVITVRDTLKINEIIKRIKDNRFIIRPPYQRSEVKSRQKASKIIESIILGVKLPPIYVYSKFGSDGRERLTVLDGQQRLISILKYMGEPVTDEKYNYIKTYKNKYSLCGLKELEGLNGKVYEEGPNSINQFKRDPIEKYEIEVIKINEQGNENFNFIDMFLRLNKNPCPIEVNSFEMWNSFNIVNCLDRIKEIAMYDLFKQDGNKMKEEELVTTLAYINYKEISIENIDDFFSVYVSLVNKNKQNEHYEVQFSIPRKYEITNFLEKIDPGSQNEIEFLRCIETVNDFVDKLKILSEKDENVLIRIFNPHKKNPKIGSKKDFYMTWLILQKLDTHIIKTYKREILEDLQEAFKLMKNMPSNKDANSFIDYIKSIIDKYSKYSIRSI